MSKALWDHKGITILILALVVPLAWNLWNLRVMQDLPAVEHVLRHGRTIAAIDDTSYLGQAEDVINHLHGRATRYTEVIRYPGYGLLYLLCRMFGPPEVALGLLALLHILFFAVSVWTLWWALVHNGIRPYLAWGSSLLIAILPTFHGFLFHTLTESVTPAYLLICTSSALLYAHKGSRRWLLIGAVAWMLLTLTRPVLIWGGAAMLAAVWLRADQHRLKHILLITGIALLPTLGWWSYQSISSGRAISLHPVYPTGATNIFRPTHKAFWELAKSWGMQGPQFHVIMQRAFDEALTCGSDDAHARAFMATAPASQLGPGLEQDITMAFRKWQEFTCSTHAHVIASGEGFEDRPYADEQYVIGILQRATIEYRQEQPFHYHVVVPLNVLKQMVFHSNLNLYIFQHEYRGRWWMETMRWLSLIIHVVLLSLLFILPWCTVPPPVRVAAFCALAYMILLAYAQRGIEERYTLPVLHLSVLLAPFLLQLILRQKAQQPIEKDQVRSA